MLGVQVEYLSARDMQHVPYLHGIMVNRVLKDGVGAAKVLDGTIFQADLEKLHVIARTRS